ncbi:MAG: GTP cyclohydrolase II [Micrococcales bacterium]|nr:GTP cyclohydrolase II [Micrococcales bacterium]
MSLTSISQGRSGGEPSVTRVVETRLPTRHGVFRMIGFLGNDGTEHIALVMPVAPGTGAAAEDVSDSVAPLVRLHSECLTGDALGSWRCDCGTQLDAALGRIALEGAGALLYVRGHEGRGIGLLEKLKAYRLQDGGVDTLDANLALGHPADARDYTQAAAILADLGLRRIRLMSSNPAKEHALTAAGIEIVERTGMFVPEREQNLSYLSTKRSRMGHDSPTGDVWGELLAGRVPVSAPTPGDEELIDRYGALVATGPDVVVAQMAQSLDGFIATRSGDGQQLSGAEDHAHLHRLRALVQAVVVGAGSVVADDPQLTVREVPGPNPVRVLIDPHARIPTTSQVLTTGAAPTLWLVGSEWSPPPASAAERVATEPGGGGHGGGGHGGGEDGVADHVTVLRLEAADFAPERLVEVLRRRGLSRLLIEGGGDTVSRFLATGCLDRLYVTTVPVLLGDGVPGVRGPAVDRVSAAPRPRARHFRLGEDTCTELVLR